MGDNDLNAYKGLGYGKRSFESDSYTVHANSDPRSYLKTNGGLYDAVVMSDASMYDDLRSIVSKIYRGRIVLIENVGRNVPGNFIRVRAPVRPSYFDKVIRTELSREG